MSEYGLLLGSALVSALVSLRGLFSPRRRDPKRILVVKLDHLGDVILATPALRALRDAHPAAVIDALVRPGSAVLLEGGALVDRVLTYDAPRFRRPDAPAGTRVEPLEVPHGSGAVPRMPPGRYDWIVELRGDARTTWLLPWTARPSRRADRGTVRLRHWLARRRRRSRPPLHEVETNLEVVRPLIPRMPESPRLELPPWPAGEIELTGALAGRLPESRRGGPLIVLHPGASWPPRAWRVERFAAVAAALRESYDATIVVLGTAEEAPLAAAMGAAGGPPGSLWLFGSLSLPAVAALLRRARLYIGNDGGIAHVAAACGTAAIVLFGPEDAARFRPWSPRARVLQHPDHCVPRCRTVCRRREPCVNLITTADVLAAAREMLAAESDGGERAGRG